MTHDERNTYISADSAADCADCADCVCGVVGAGVLSLFSDSSVFDAGVVNVSDFFVLKQPNTNEN